MNAHQRRLSRQQRRRGDWAQQQRQHAAKRRTCDADLPLYLPRDLGNLPSDHRLDAMPPIVRGHRRPRE